MTNYTTFTVPDLLKKLNFAEENGDPVVKNMVLGELLKRGIIKRKKRNTEPETRKLPFSMGREPFKPVFEQDYIVTEEFEKDSEPANTESDGYQEKWR